MNEEVKSPREPDRSAGKTELPLRPFPYPYKAAFAICNDLDGLRSFAEMKAVHDVLNGRKMTPCGPGLGLEIGDSLHFFTVHPQQDDTLAYFEGLTPQSSAEAPALREGIQSGLLDIVHTWGNYSQRGGFFREQALWVVEELDKYGLKIPLWVNHGDRHNFQNLGRSDALGDVRETSSVRGDKSEVLEFHADLLPHIGIRYLWIKELTTIIGQERALNWQDGLDQGSDLAKAFIKNVVTSSTLFTGRPPQMSNRLIRPITLRHGGTFYELLRYGWFAKDGSDFLPELLSLKFLRRLVDVGGACLLYMHLGKGRPSPEAPFSKESYKALERLAQWHRAGDLWVTTASRLCQYVELRQRLTLRRLEKAEGEEISGIFDSSGLSLAPPIGGLTFYWPETSVPVSNLRTIKLTVGGQEHTLARNPLDHTGRVSFTVPFSPQPYCWE